VTNSFVPINLQYSFILRELKLVEYYKRILLKELYRGGRKLSDTISNIFFVVIVMTPIYAVLLWTYFCPEESLLWGKRSMYKEEPELAEGAIRYAKIASLISMIVLTILLILFVFYF
jgi:hypothetical protein